MNKLSIDVKKLLLKHRNDNGITLIEHLQLLGQFGWTPDEYELGEKEQEEYDLEEEREILKDPQGFKVIYIESGSAKPNSREEIVWAKVTTKFFQTTKKGKGNYTIAKIGVIVNTALKRQFEQKRAQLSAIAKNRGNNQWGFHGNAVTVLLSLAQEGFKLPENPQAKVTATGFYFSLFSDYATLGGKGGTHQVLVCSLLPGESFQSKVNERNRQPGFDSNYSPNGNGLIVFEPAQILPKYIITFSAQEAQEREQED